MAARGTPEELAFQMRLTRRLAEAGRDYIRPFIPSKTLRAGITTRQYDFNYSAIFIPHYWALFLHDGRGSFGTRSANYLVYFRNPAHDPRLAGGRVERYQSERRLTQSQWKYWQRQNAIADSLGVPRPMIVRRRVGPMRGHHWFENNRQMGFFAGKIADDIVSEEWSRFVRDQLKDYLNVQVDKIDIII